MHEFRNDQSICILPFPNLHDVSYNMAESPGIIIAMQILVVMGMCILIAKHVGNVY